MQPYLKTYFDLKFQFSILFLHPNLQVYGEVKVGLKLGWYFGIMIALLPATFMIMSVIASIIIEGVPIRYTQYSSFDSSQVC